MSRNRLTLVAGLLVAFSMVLASCAPVTTPPAGQTTSVPSVEPTAAPAFSTPNPILSDLRVRQALAYCTDKLSLIKAAYPLNPDADNEKLIMNTFIPSTQWAYAGDANITIYPFDAAKGGQLLDEAGWTLNADTGYRENADGQELDLTFTTTNASFRQTWAAVWEKQMGNCGIMIKRQHVPASWWFGDKSGLQVRDFELGAYAWVGQTDPGGQTLYACDQIPLPSNNWSGQNYMGWCNQLASDNIKKANNTLIQADRKAAYTIVQQEFTKDMISIPLFNRSSYYAWVPGFAGLDITPGDQDYYMWNANDWVLTGTDGKAKDTIVLGFTQEPSSLFTLITSEYAAVAAAILESGMAFTSQNFDYQAREQKALSTIESGLALNNDVEVIAGDSVADANGNLIVLDAAATPPQEVIDSTGTKVAYTGQALTMKQLVVTYEFIDGMTFSDGVPLAQEDLELGYKVQCDKEVGAISYIFCDMTKSITFNGLSYTVTWMPGRQDPLYFLAPYGWYAAHRVIESEGAYKGQMLKDVPPKDWGTLPEVSETPLDVGPYMVSEWKKGEFIKYTANPYFYGSAPKTPNIVIQIITPENAEAQLLAGQVDLLDTTTLVSMSQTLKDAGVAGTVTIFVTPSATWEHIDMNLFVK